MGGIQRFKLGVHGAAHRVAVIIGYIQEGDAKQWLKRINGWLSDAGKADPLWTGEQLTTAEARDNAVHRFHSIHRREVTGGRSVELWHLWIVLVPGSMKRRTERLERRGAQGQTEFPFMVGVLKRKSRQV